MVVIATCDDHERDAASARDFWSASPGVAGLDLQFSTRRRGHAAPAWRHGLRLSKLSGSVRHEHTNVWTWATATVAVPIAIERGRAACAYWMVLAQPNADLGLASARAVHRTEAAPRQLVTSCGGRNDACSDHGIVLVEAPSAKGRGKLRLSEKAACGVHAGETVQDVQVEIHSEACCLRSLRPLCNLSVRAKPDCKAKHSGGSVLWRRDAERKGSLTQRERSGRAEGDASDCSAGASAPNPVTPRLAQARNRSPCDEARTGSGIRVGVSPCVTHRRCVGLGEGIHARVEATMIVVATCDEHERHDTTVSHQRTIGPHVHVSPVSACNSVQDSADTQRPAGDTDSDSQKWSGIFVTNMHTVGLG
jgi:hypothetical protein